MPSFSDKGLPAQVRTKLSQRVLESMVSTSGLRWVRLFSLDDGQELRAPSVAGPSTMRARFSGWPLLPESVTIHPR
jgi:hypothetical protein